MKKLKYFIGGALVIALFLIPLKLFADAESHEHTVSSFNLFQLIKPLGIITYSFIALTMIAGFFRWKLKYHRLLAIMTIVCASIHAGLIFYLH